MSMNKRLSKSYIIQPCELTLVFAQLAEAEEYTDCTSAKG